MRIIHLKCYIDYVFSWYGSLRILYSFTSADLKRLMTMHLLDLVLSNEAK
jgi:hypothetical protein